MSWLIEAFTEQSIVWLIISTVIAFISGLISSWFTYRFKRQEIIDITVADMQRKQHELVLEAEKSREERVRREVIRWANPILGAVDELVNRLDNILKHSGYVALNKGYQENSDPDWSISYDYFMHSTLYLFGQYFAWVQMFQEELNFELFQSQEEKDKIFSAIKEVGSSLGRYPLSKYKYPGTDTQVFRLQQRAIGELLIHRENGQRSCLSYQRFLEKLNDGAISQYLKPLRSLLEGVDPRKPEKRYRWKRLKVTQQALEKLKTNCEELLKITKPAN